MSCSRVALVLCLPFAIAGCDPGDPPEDDESSSVGGKADTVSSESAKSYSGIDYYDIDRFDVDNNGQFCGFVRARAGAITSSTKTISLESVTYPLTTSFATDDRPVKLLRLDSSRSLFERPIFKADVESDPQDFSVLLYVNRLSLEPEMMIVQHANGSLQVCRDLVADS